MKFSASTVGFYDDGHPAIPDDTVEISAAEYDALMEAQAQGQKIEAGPDGRPVAMDLPSPRLNVIKASAAKQVDAAAEAARELFITPGSGQAMVYQEKVDEARATEGTANPSAADFPHLAAEVGITGNTIAEVAATVLAQRAQWLQVSAAIESQRLGAKLAIAEAADAAGVQAVLDGLTWPTPEAAT